MREGAVREGGVREGAVRERGGREGGSSEGEGREGGSSEGEGSDKERLCACVGEGGARSNYSPMSGKKRPCFLIMAGAAYKTVQL